MIMHVYNNSVHSNTKKTLHELFKNYEANFVNEFKNRFLKKEASFAIERAEWLRSKREYLMKLWNRIAKYQSKSYNAYHISKCFQKDDKILLRSVNIRTLRLKKKIDHRQFNSFTILKRINSQAYQLKLSQKYDAIHDVFYVSLLELWY